MPSLVRGGKALPHNLEAEGAAVAAMTFTLHNTDAIGCAALVADESVHAIVTSPPYYGLRRYAGVPDLVWGCDPACVHEWGSESRRTTGNAPSNKSTLTTNGGKGPMDGDKYHYANAETISTGSTCLRCNAWRGQLGAEPTPDLYVAHLVDVFRAWRPKLHRTGVCVVNLGDSYAANRSYQVPSTKGGDVGNSAGMRCPDGIAPKNLLLIPHRFALAMQADGWVLRNECPWVKPNAMPSSVTDRLTVGHEWFMLFAKEQRYYWDAGAVRRESVKGAAGSTFTEGKTLVRAGRVGQGPRADDSQNRNLRTSDVWLDGLDATIAHVAGYLDHLREIRDGGGLLTDPDGEPLALYASTKGTDAEHYAAYGAHLVTPWVRAGTSERGACSVCRSPWEMVVEKTLMEVRASERRNLAHEAGAGGGRTLCSGTMTRAPSSITIGWRPTCSHVDAPTMPATVADPFAGTGTTLDVAIREGRNAIGCEPSTKYYPDAVKRLESVAAQPSLFAAKIDVNAEARTIEQLGLF